MRDTLGHPGFLCKYVVLPSSYLATWTIPHRVRFTMALGSSLADKQSPASEAEHLPQMFTVLSFCSCCSSGLPTPHAGSGSLRELTTSA